MVADEEEVVVDKDDEEENKNRRSKSKVSDLHTADEEEVVGLKKRKMKAKESGSKKKKLTVEDESEEEEFLADDEEVPEEAEEDPEDFDSAEQALTEFAQNRRQSSESSAISAYVFPSSDDSVVMTFRTSILDLLKDNRKLKQKEFVVSVELLLAFVRYKQRFSTFFIMCESLPELFATAEMGESISLSSAKKKSLIKSGEIYLTTLASNLLEFFKKCRKLEEGKDAIEVLDNVFPYIDDELKEYYRAILNRTDVRKMIKSVSKKDEIFMKLVPLKDFKTVRFQLVDFNMNKFCDQELGEIRTPENEEYIFYILKNLQNYSEKGHHILEKKAKRIIHLLEDCNLEFGTNDRTIVTRLRPTTLFNLPDYSNQSASSSSSMSKRYPAAPAASSSSSSPTSSSSPARAAKVSSSSSSSSSSSTRAVLSSSSGSTRAVSATAAIVEHTPLAKAVIYVTAQNFVEEVKSTPKSSSASTRAATVSLTKATVPSSSSSSSAFLSSPPSSSSAIVKHTPVQDTSDDPCNQESMQIVMSMNSENRERVLQLISTSLDNILYAAFKWDFQFSDIIHAHRKHFTKDTNIRNLLKRWNQIRLVNGLFLMIMVMY